MTGTIYIVRVVRTDRAEMTQEDRISMENPVWYLRTHGIGSKSRSEKSNYLTEEPS